MRHLIKPARTYRVIRPILVDHAATVAPKDDEVVWLSAYEIEPSSTLSIPKLLEFGYGHFHASSGGIEVGHKPFGDVELNRAVQTYKHLRVLDLRQTTVTAEGLACLAQLKDLEWLWLDHTQCTDGGLAHLHALKTLQELTINQNSNVSDGGLRTLEEALPKCTIHR
jgi:hypothetical protein